MSELEFALSLADKADQITMAKYQANDLVVTQKPDLTPVTEADQQVEQVIRSEIEKAYPADSILGEEYGVENTGAPRQWIIDPIDGTKNFVRGVPVWATLIALADGDEVVLGVVSAPALGRRWWATKGQGAFVSDALTGQTKQIKVSQVSDLEHASLAYASLEGWSQAGRLDKFLELAANCWRTRGYGDFWIYMLLAEGAVDIAAEPELEVYDMAALVPVVIEAGGSFNSLTGIPGPWGGNAVATNNLLLNSVMEYLG